MGVSIQQGFFERNLRRESPILKGCTTVVTVHRGRRRRSHQEMTSRGVTSPTPTNPLQRHAALTGKGPVEMGLENLTSER